jgi:hypothetical protein
VENDSSTSHSKKRGASPKALWLLLAGVLLVEGGLRLLPAGYTIRSVNERMRDILSLPAPRVQIMGDSVAASGINAANLADAAGLPPGTADNYSLPGTSPMFAYFTLRRELDAGRTPGRILFAPHPANLESPMIDRFIGRFGTMSECAELLREGAPPPDWLFGAACRLSVAMRNREEFRVAVTEGNFGFFQTLFKPAPSLLGSRVKYVSPPIPPPPLNWPPADYPPQLTAAFFVDALNARYIDKFCDLAAEHGIEVEWVTVPVIAAFKDRAMSGGGEAKYEAYLQGFVARHRNVTLLRPQLEVYPDNCFSDPWHLNVYGAVRFTNELGAEMKKAAK